MSERIRPPRAPALRQGLSRLGLLWTTSSQAHLSAVDATLEDVDDTYWLRVTRLGLGACAGFALAGLVYAALSAGGSRALITVVLAVVLIGSLGALAVNSGRIVACRHRGTIMRIWAVALPVVATGLAWLDGSVASPFVTLYFLAIAFAASATPPGMVVAVGALSAAGFAILPTITDASVPWAWSMFSLVIVLLVALTSAWLAATQRLRTRWLRELSKEFALLAGSHSSLLAAAGEGIYMLDADGRVTFANPMACRLLEYDPDELLGIDAHTRFHHSHRDGTAASRADCDILGAMAMRIPVDVATSVYWRRDGAPFEVDHSIAPLDEGGAVIVFRDVSEVREAERQKEDFISVVSHELRTPLTSIRGALGLLAAGAGGRLDPAAAETVQIASRNVDRLSRLINDMLDIERLQSGKAMLELQTCDIAALIRTAVEEMRVMAENAGITLRVSCRPLEVLVDPDRIQQILANLISNAVKFSEPGKDVLIRAFERGDTVRVDVVDRGRGIPPTHLERVFGRFEQVDASDSRRKGGTGLGLAICDGLVRQHGGRIWVESVLGEGSTFSFTLPQQSRARSLRGHGPLVLVVSDDLSFRDDAMSILASGGYQTIAAPSAEHGLEVAVTQHPLAILVDARAGGDEDGSAHTLLEASPETAQTPVIVVDGPFPPDVSTASVGAPPPHPLLDKTLVNAVGRAMNDPRLPPVFLVVGADREVAEAVESGLRRCGVRSASAGTNADARAWCAQIVPDAIVLDLDLPDGDGTDFIRWMKEHSRLSTAEVVVYGTREMSPIDRLRLGVDDSQVFVTADATPDGVVEHVLRLTASRPGQEVGV